jgi:hypothetical protein
VSCSGGALGAKPGAYLHHDASTRVSKGASDSEFGQSIALVTVTSHCDWHTASGPRTVISHSMARFKLLTILLEIVALASNKILVLRVAVHVC